MGSIDEERAKLSSQVGSMEEERAKLSSQRAEDLALMQVSLHPCRLLGRTQIRMETLCWTQKAAFPYCLQLPCITTRPIHAVHPHTAFQQVFGTLPVGTLPASPHCLHPHTAGMSPHCQHRPLPESPHCLNTHIPVGAAHPHTLVHLHTAGWSGDGRWACVTVGLFDRGGGDFGSM